MPFEKGESGNPAGRPRGARNRATLLMQNLLADDAEAIGRKAIEMAIAGDLAAIRQIGSQIGSLARYEPFYRGILRILRRIAPTVPIRL